MNDLTKIANRHGTDKGSKPVGGLSAKNYTETYYPLLAPIRDKPITLLEIGVKRGASVKMWDEFFPNATIIGVDINPECKKYESDRIKIRIGDQEDTQFLSKLVREFGSFDIVIDDGGHTTRQQQSTWERLAGAANKFYFIEDVHAESMPQYMNTPKTTTEYFSLLSNATITRSLIYITL